MSVMLARPAFALARIPDVGGSELALDFSTYPPKAHQERINGYARHEKLFMGQHKQVFAVTPQPYQ